MYSFMVPYLIETKKLSKEVVVTKITHNIFIATIFTAFISIFIIDQFGYKAICVANSLIEGFVYLILFFMKEKQVIFGQTAGILHGVTKSLEMVSKSIIYSGEKRENSQYGNYSAIKSFSSIVANIMGQEFFYLTGRHDVSLYLTGISLIMSIFFSFMIPNCSKIRLKTANFKAEHLIFSFFYVISNLFFISTIVYSSYIFIERKKNAKAGSTSLLLFRLVYPFRVCIAFIVKFFAIFNPEITISYKFNEDILIYGYIDALARLFGLLPYYYLVGFDFSSKFRATALIFLLSFLLLIQYLTTKTNNLDVTYGLTIVNIIMSSVCLGISNNGFKNFTNVHYIYASTLLVSACIHGLISYLSTRWKIDVTTRIKYYSVINLIMILVSLAMVLIFFGYKM